MLSARIARVRSATVPVARRAAASEICSTAWAMMPGQDEADGDREDRDRDEDVLQQGDERGLAGVDGADGQQVAGAVERHDGDHRAGELEAQRAADAAAGRRGGGRETRRQA